ncbi:hypothetical protein [Clostridium kluyveri]|nr:hypothetical protein [Clostridium kluyveri]UZQ49883.1 hypothetical protein OP486_18335 [Clostridium kluyveri]
MSYTRKKPVISWWTHNRLNVLSNHLTSPLYNNVFESTSKEHSIVEDYYD